MLPTGSDDVLSFQGLSCFLKVLGPDLSFNKFSGCAGTRIMFSFGLTRCSCCELGGVFQASMETWKTKIGASPHTGFFLSSSTPVMLPFNHMIYLLDLRCKYIVFLHFGPCFRTNAKQIFRLRRKRAYYVVLSGTYKCKGVGVLTRRLLTLPFRACC